MNIREFVNLFNDDCQMIRLFDMANKEKIVFEGEINKMPDDFDNCTVIYLDTMIEDIFDGHLGIFIATENEEDYLDNEEDDEEDDEDDEWYD